MIPNQYCQTHYQQIYTFYDQEIQHLWQLINSCYDQIWFMIVMKPQKDVSQQKEKEQAHRQRNQQCSYSWPTPLTDSLLMLIIINCIEYDYPYHHHQYPNISSKSSTYHFSSNFFNHSLYGQIISMFWNPATSYISSSKLNLDKFVEVFYFVSVTSSSSSDVFLS